MAVCAEGGAYPLIQLIEYDWAFVARCPGCGHTTTWGARDLLEKVGGDRLGVSMRHLAEALAEHCKEVPPVCSLIQGAGMEAWSQEKYGGCPDDWAFRDRRLRNFLVEHGLPMDLADERKAAADAWRAEYSPRHGRS